MSDTIIVTSATPILDNLKIILEQKLKVKIGNYSFEYEIDPSLIAGLKINFNDTQYHYDLQHQIRYIERELL